MTWAGVMPAMTTAFDANYAVDHAFLAQHAAWLLGNGCTGLVMLGSLGEGATLDHDEKVEVLKTAVRVANGKAPVVAAISSLSKSIRPDDQFILIILGHGSLSDSKPELVLPGPDLDPDTLAKSLAAVSADNQVILNFSGTGGDFLKSLGKKNRVNIAATSPQENAEPVFAEFFLRALESNRADGEAVPAAGTKDGATSLLEAYNWATHQTALWIMRQVGNKDGTWTLSGKESVEIFKKLYDGPEAPITPGGMRADGSRKLSDDSDPSKPDEPVPLVLPPDLKPHDTANWAGRRIINEHAQLEDAGLEDGALSALRGDKGYDPIPIGKPGEEGARAARVTFGKPALLPAPEK